MGGQGSGRQRGSVSVNTYRSHLSSALDVLERTGEQFVTLEDKTRVHSYASKMGMKVKTVRHLMVTMRGRTVVANALVVSAANGQ